MTTTPPHLAAVRASADPRERWRLRRIGVRLQESDLLCRVSVARACAGCWRLQRLKENAPRLDLGVESDTL